MGFTPALNQQKDITLQDEKLNIIPKEFYVANVVDEREARNAIAWLVTTGITGQTAKTTAVDLHGGALPAIKRFIAYGLPADKSLHPIVISIKKLTVVETPLAGGLVEGRITLRMSFNLKKDSDQVHLSDYNGSAIYNRDARDTKSIEPHIKACAKKLPALFK